MLITHDAQVAARAERILFMRDGEILILNIWIIMIQLCGEINIIKGKKMRKFFAGFFLGFVISAIILVSSNGGNKDMPQYTIEYKWSYDIILD